MASLGYDKPLYILPFDHRGIMAKTFGLKSTELLSIEQKNYIKEFKMFVYQGFKNVSMAKIPIKYAAVLCDEEFGSDVLREAKKDGFVTILTTEKSGVESFTLEYGENFAAHIEKFKPDFTKVLIRYNPKDSEELRQIQKEKLKMINDYSHNNNYKFLLEVLVPPTREQLAEAEDSEEEYDKKLRANLTADVIHEMHDFGIEPDVWKLEGFSEKENYQKVILAIQSGERKKVGLVVLGRGAGEHKVEEWLHVGSQVPGIIGFAVGRTVFWNAWEKFYRKEIAKEEVVRIVSDNFIRFYKIFTEASISS